LMLPGASCWYENPVPRGCERNSMFDFSLHEYGFTSVVRF